MLNDLLPFEIPWNGVVVSGACLWSLALYLICFPVAEWIMAQLNRWFDFAEQQFLYSDKEEFERTRPAREAQNAFNASILSIVPFLGLGTLCNWAVDASLGGSWSISLGIMACIGCGVYELGRRSS